MINEEKAIGILTLNRLIEEGHIIPTTNQTNILFWISYEIIQSTKYIDVISEAEKILMNSVKEKEKK